MVKKIILLFLSVYCFKLIPQTGTTKTQLNYEYALNDPFNTRIYTLSNGLKVYLSVNKEQPRISTMIAVKAGSKNDPSYATGLAHYLEHMLFKGTDKFGTKNAEKEEKEIKKIEDLYETYRVTKDEAKRKKLYHQIDSISHVAAEYAIPNEYDKMMAAIGANETNAFTIYDETVYINDIPSNQLENWLKVEAERFRKPVMRLFHTELEAVYEEKNGSIDNDQENAFDLLMDGLFPTNNYGQQTVIGTIDHLKNPSLKEIINFYNKWYVPNNMALIMSGDFNPDEAISMIEKYMGVWVKKDFVPYVPKKEAPATKVIKKEYQGPDREFVYIGYRCGGADTEEGEMMQLISAILSNRKAGLFDVNLNQAQKVIDATSFHFIIKDYGILGLSASPKSGQKLEEVEKLILGQVDLLKKGDFPDWLLTAVVNELKLENTRVLEENGRRAAEMLNAFVNDIKWQKYIEKMDRLSKVTKSQVIEFANNFFKDNYVVVYKRQGESQNKIKVVKPEITPVELDRESVSPFAASIYNAKVKDIEPKFMDFNKDLEVKDINSMVKLIYAKNSSNKIFEYYYYFNMGSDNSKLLPIAFGMLDFCGTSTLNPTEFKQELYKLGCSLESGSDYEKSWIKLSGLSENFEKAADLVESLLSDPMIEEQKFKNYKEDLIKQREDNEKDKNLILKWALLSYARYGEMNPYTNILNNQELAQLKVDDIVAFIKDLKTYKHDMMYYGPDEFPNLVNFVTKYRVFSGASYKSVPSKKEFALKKLDNHVYWVDFDMTQAEIMIINDGAKFDIKLMPDVFLYNSYFGDGMSGVVFQDLRESKALAYSVYSRYSFPTNAKKPFYNKSYIGTQADKLGESLKGMIDLLNNLPKSDAGFSAAKEHVLQEIRTNRISRSNLFFEYQLAKDLGIDYDYRKDVFAHVQHMTFTDVKNFHGKYIKGKPSTILVLGKKKLLDMKVLKSYGPVQELSLKAIFAY